VSNDTSTFLIFEGENMVNSLTTYIKQYLSEICMK